MTEKTTAGRGAVAGQVERPVRPLVERLRDAAQGVDLGADGMGWSPDPSLMREAADEIERLRADRDSWAQQASERAQDALDLVATERKRCATIVRRAWADYGCTCSDASDLADIIERGA